MIYTKEIHKFDSTAIANRTYNETMGFIESVAADYEIAYNQVRELKDFGLFTEDAGNGIINSVIEACRVLGQKIIEIIERMKNYISDKIADWKQNRWTKKSKEQKLREIERAAPGKIDDIRVALTNGDLEFATFKDLNDFLNNVDSILDEIAKKNVDPKSIRGKWENTKKKFLNNQDVFKNVITALGVIVSAGTLCLSYKKYKDNKVARELDPTRDIGRIKETQAKMKNLANAAKNIDRELRVEYGADYANQYMEKSEILAMISAEVERISTGCIDKKVALDIKLLDGLADGAQNVQNALRRTINDASSAAKNARDIAKAYGGGN